jgi:hypothetical protein
MRLFSVGGESVHVVCTSIIYYAKSVNNSIVRRGPCIDLGVNRFVAYRDGLMGKMATEPTAPHNPQMIKCVLRSSVAVH